MPIEYHIDRDRGVVFTTFSGAITSTEVRQHVEILRKDPAFNRNLRALTDCSQVTTYETPPDFFRNLAQSTPYTAQARRAVVAPQDFMFGLARMFQMWTQGADVGVFRSMEEARRWLEIE